jgi:rare lipoprotein A
LLAVSALGACAPAERAAAPRPSTGMRGEAAASPRIVSEGPIPRGGGVYKLGSPYQIGGRWYVPRVDPGYDRVGVASWYGADFHGRRTANGEIYDMRALTAAHPTLPLPSYVTVTNLSNGRTLLVRVNDRGPYANGRIIDLSWAVARHLDMARQGTERVRVRYAGPAPLDGNDAHERRFLAAQRWSRGLASAQDGRGLPRLMSSPVLVRRGRIARGETIDRPTFALGAGMVPETLRSR